MDSRQSSVHPSRPKESQVLVRVSGEDFGLHDKILVYGSSLCMIGSLVWVPTAIALCYRRLRCLNTENDENNKQSQRRKKIYLALIMALLGLVVWGGPHQNRKVGRLLRFKSWSLWKAWLKFVAFEVVLDNRFKTDIAQVSKDRSILAFIPHGIIPIAYGLGVITDTAEKVLGNCLPIVATAVRAFPFLSSIVSLVGAIDASRSKVQKLMASSERVGINPGGIAEIFESYPKPGTHPDEEYAIVRKGFLKMAIQTGRSVVPIYCFGSTKMFRRLQLPLLETLSNLLRIGVCLFYGVRGLPLPFRQKLTYIVGEPINPPATTTGRPEEVDLNKSVNRMHQEFCNSLENMFERHKHVYGWGHKSLKIISK